MEVVYDATAHSLLSRQCCPVCSIFFIFLYRLEKLRRQGAEQNLINLEAYLKLEALNRFAADEFSNLVFAKVSYLPYSLVDLSFNFDHRVHTDTGYSYCSGSGVWIWGCMSAEPEYTGGACSVIFKISRLLRRMHWGLVLCI